jgi:hypothetical protein
MEYIHPLSGYLQIVSDLSRRSLRKDLEMDVQSVLRSPDCQEEVSIITELVALKLSTINQRYQDVLSLWYGLDGIKRSPQDAGREHGYGVGTSWIYALRRNALTELWERDLKNELRPFLPI